jgi:hypothetical protein
LEVRKRLIVTTLAAVVLGGAASSATAADTNVNPYTCATFSGGQVTRPAGSTIVVRQGFAEQTLGILTAWLNAQTTTVTINGGPAIDLTSDWNSPAQAGDGWISFVSYPTAVTLGAGDTMTIALTLGVVHVVPEVFNPAVGGTPGKPAVNEGSTTYTCTITGV